MYSGQYLRNYLRDEIIGRLPPPSLPANARSRPVYDHPKFQGWEIMLDVWPDARIPGYGDARDAVSALEMSNIHPL